MKRILLSLGAMAAVAAPVAVAVSCNDDEATKPTIQQAIEEKLLAWTPVAVADTTTNEDIEIDFRVNPADTAKIMSDYGYGSTPAEFERFQTEVLDPLDTKLKSYSHWDSNTNSTKGLEELLTNDLDTPAQAHVDLYTEKMDGSAVDNSIKLYFNITTENELTLAHPATASDKATENGVTKEYLNATEVAKAFNHIAKHEAAGTTAPIADFAQIIYDELETGIKNIG